MLLRKLILGVLLLMPVVVSAEVVNINTADAALLAEHVNGIGLKKAEAIVQYRQTHGPFKSVEDLAKVKGIGDKLIEKNRTSISVNTK